MISSARLHRKRSLGLFVGCMFLGLTATLPVVAQQADQLQQRLEQLKQEYETTTQALELRMATLEQQIQSQKESSEKAKEATVSAADLAAERAAKAVLGENSDQVGAKFQQNCGDTIPISQEAGRNFADANICFRGNSVCPANAGIGPK